MSYRLILDWLTLYGVSREGPLLEISSSSFIAEFLDPERLSRTRVFLIFSATSLLSSGAFVEDLAPFEDENSKTGVDTDGT